MGDSNIDLLSTENKNTLKLLSVLSSDPMHLRHITLIIQREYHLQPGPLLTLFLRTSSIKTSQLLNSFMTYLPILPYVFNLNPKRN